MSFEKLLLHGPLRDPRAEAVLARLHALSDRQLKSMRRHRFAKAIRDRLFGKADRAAFLRDKLVALDPDKGCLAYLLCRALNARRVVEAGTSFGASTIYLAAAVRDNLRAGGQKGIVIGTEIEPTKATAARANLAEAGLADLVEVREGDMRETLRDAGGPVDFLLIDTWIPLAKPTIEIMTPQLRTGAIVLCDNTGQYHHEYREYLQYVRDQANGFRSMLVPHQGGLELSVRLPR